MSKFSNYLKYLIDRNQQSIAQLSRMSGVERTSIHKALTDERTLAYTSVEKLALTLCLSPEEKKNLLCYHSMLLQGEDLFESRQIITDIFQALAEIPVSALTQKQKTLWFKSLPAPRDGQMFHGELAVTDIIKYILDQEVRHQNLPCIYLNFSLEETFLNKYMFCLYQQEEVFIDMYHIVPFPYRKNMETSARYGLKLLEWLLPLCLVADNHYHPYFYYDHSTVSYYSDPLPYFILVSDYLLCLSPDIKTAVIYNNQELIQYYRQSTIDTMEECEPLLTCSTDPFDILKQYIDYSTLDGYYSVMAQPCFGKFYTREFIAKKVPKELPFYQPLVEAADQRFQILRNLKGNYYTVFTYEGLRTFCETGTFCDMPKEFVQKCTKEERLAIIQSLKADIADGSITGLIVNPSRFRIPEYLTFTISPDKGIHIFTTLMFEERAYHSNLHIIEPMISKAFFDFIVSLPASEYVYSKEDTLNILDELIEYCSTI